MFSESGELSQRLGVKQATRSARRAVLAAFAATALLVGALTLERLTFHRASQKAVQDVKAALKVSGTILLEDERLTMSANLAAASGEARWVQRYEARLPAIDQAILVS